MTPSTSCDDTASKSRRSHVRKRNEKIEKVAMELARSGIWPSPAAVAARAGMSESVVDRQASSLLEARRTWVRKTGRQHSHWRDEETVEQTKAPGTIPSVRETTPAASMKETEKALKRTVRKSRAELALSREECRRLRLGVRPAEITQLLESGSSD